MRLRACIRARRQLVRNADVQTLGNREVSFLNRAGCLIRFGEIILLDTAEVPAHEQGYEWSYEGHSNRQNSGEGRWRPLEARTRRARQ